MVFDHHHYVPILLAKRGERRGLRDLASRPRAHMTPLFVVPPIQWDFEAGEPAKDVDTHLAPVTKELRDCWGTDRAFLDLFFLHDGVRLENGQHPIEYVFEQGNQHGTKLIPCIHPGRDGNFRAAVAAVHARQGGGACVRLGLAQWPLVAGIPILRTLLEDLRLTPAEVDLVLDAGAEVIGSPNITSAAMRAELASLPRALEWRSLTVASAGFPPPPLPSERGLTLIDRADWNAYRAVVTGPKLPRIPTFADYGIAAPNPTVDVDPKMMSISASFRYTIDQAWIFAKGELFKGRAGSGRGGDAMRPLAARLYADSRFAGAAHCTGDEWLHQLATAGGSGGNPEAWRRHGTSHHLTHVISQIATLYGP